MNGLKGDTSLRTELLPPLEEALPHGCLGRRDSSAGSAVPQRRDPLGLSSRYRRKQRRAAPKDHPGMSYEQSHQNSDDGVGGRPMTFKFSKEVEALRADIQTFISKHLTAEVRAELADWRDGHGVGSHAAAFLREVVTRGWSGVSWPREYGGQGQSTAAQFVVNEEFYRSCGTSIGGGGTGAPAILAFGTEEQKMAYIPGSINFSIRFCQGYSEPHCGTDLAGIRCRAIRKGDRFVVNGQKIYTTNAQNSSHIFLLARSDPQSRRQAGLSVLLVPMNLPGITVRPLWTIQHDPRAPVLATYAESRTNEVFFDNVEIPDSCLLGDEGDGWNVAQRGLNLDRITAFRYLISVMRTEDIVNLLKQDVAIANSRRDDPAVRDKVADLWTEAQVCRLMTMRSLSIDASGADFIYEGSAEKVFAPEHGVRATEAIAQILGPYAQLMSDCAKAPNGGVFAHNLLGAFQSTVNHGSVQVMRDQIARKGLDMPRAGRRPVSKETT
jgi:alkylation response protein AidB-like acyl-CoA dehydrogenase